MTRKLKHQTVRDVLVGAVLMALLAITVVLGKILTGTPSLISGLLIAAMKAGLVLAFFMDLIKDSVQVRAIAAAGLLWLGIMFSLTLSDYLARRPEVRAPYTGVAATPAPPLEDPIEGAPRSEH